MKKKRDKNPVAKFAALFTHAVIYKDRKKCYNRNSKNKKNDDYFQLAIC
jgi:hypothetical protein